MLQQIISGAIGGVAYSLSGIFNKPVSEDFDLSKTGLTLGVAVILGAIAGYTGMDYGVLINSTMSAGATAVIEKIIKGIKKKI